MEHFHTHSIGDNMQKLHEAFEYHTSFYGPDGLYPIPGWSYDNWHQLLYTKVLTEDIELYESLHNYGAAESLDREQMMRYYCEYYDVQPNRSKKGRTVAEMLKELIDEKMPGMDHEALQALLDDQQFISVLIESPAGQRILKDQ